MGTATSGVRRRPAVADLSALALGAVLAVAGVLLTLQALADPPSVVPVLPWPVLLLAFVAAETVVLHTHVGREVHTSSLTDVPLVVGVFLVDPLTLVLTRVVGAALVQLLHRRSPVRKVAYNATVSLLDAALVVALLGAVLPGAVVLRAADPGAWAAVLLAVAVSGTVQVVAVALVIGLQDRLPPPREVAVECLRGLPVPLALSGLALVAVAGVQADLGFLWLVGAGAVALVALHRAYARAWYRYLSLERMVDLATSLRPGTQPEERTLVTVLERARDLLVAEQAHLLLLAGPDGGAGTRVSVTATGSGPGAGAGSLDLDPGVRARVVSGEPVLVGQDRTDPRSLAWLRAQGAREAVVVPVVSAGSVVALLWVVDRLSRVRPFDRDDLTVLSAVAGQVGLALQYGRLMEDVELRGRAERTLRRLAGEDALTGLANRRGLESRLSQLVAGQGAAGAVLVYGDLDGFKPVNDRLGHRAGDEVLVEVAARLVAGAGPGALVARVGGDEFVVLVPGEGTEPDTADLVGRLSRAVAAPVTTSAGEVGVGISLGAVAAQPGQSLEALLARADAAMFEAKRAARAAGPQPSEAR